MVKKIAFYINIIDCGGAERVMTNLANQFAWDGYEIVFITSYACEKEYELSKKVKRYNLSQGPHQSSRISRNIERIWKLRKICKEEQPEVLISFMAEPNIRAILATLGLKTKVIISVRNEPEREYAGRIHRFIGKRLLPLADGCVFQTEEAKCWFPQKLQKKSTIIANAVKQEFYVKERRPKKHLIVSCGRLEKQKNYPLLLDAFRDVVHKFPDARLRIYGSGAMKEILEKIIDDYNLRESVELKGQTEDVPSALACADVFVMSSDYEGMPNALMEALAMGIPCVATDCPCGGPKALIKNQVNGFLVPIRDKDCLANVIVNLLDDESEKNEIGQVAKQEAQKYRSNVIFYEWQKYIDEIAQ